MSNLKDWAGLGVLAAGVAAAYPYYRPPTENKPSESPPSTAILETPPLAIPQVATERTETVAPLALTPLVEMPRMQLSSTASQPAIVSLPDWTKPSEAPTTLDAPPPVFPATTPSFTPKKATPREAAQISEPTAPKRRQHRLVDGDSLRVLALRYYGDEQRANDILAANANVIRDPNLLPVGKMLNIPLP